MRMILRVVAIVLLVLTGGCAHFRIAPENISPATLEQRRLVRTVGWGVKEPLVSPSNCNGQGLATVMITIRPRDTFLAILTVGLVRPVQIEWTCAQANGGGR
jgi:hypothetical protein